MAIFNSYVQLPEGASGVFLILPRLQRCAAFEDDPQIIHRLSIDYPQIHRLSMYYPIVFISKLGLFRGLAFATRTRSSRIGCGNGNGSIPGLGSQDPFLLDGSKFSPFKVTGFMHTYIQIQIHIYICIYMCMYVYVCNVM